jgi:hypothetical protein
MKHENKKNRNIYRDLYSFENKDKHKELKIYHLLITSIGFKTPAGI